jgi:lipopolysaccharide biosynthesis regulator YciM
MFCVRVALLCTLCPTQAELSYLKATSLHDKAVEAWQGLSELYHATQQWSKAVDADQQLVREGGHSIHSTQATCMPCVLPKHTQGMQ